jgi:Tol biopolymer transport system component
MADERLSLLLGTEAAAGEEDKEFNIRKVWTDPDADYSGANYSGAPSPDDRYLSYTDWDTGNLAIYEIATGKKRHLTNHGWDRLDEFALSARWSPDGKQVAYDWYNGNDYCELRIIGLDGSKPRILYSNEKVGWTNPFDWSTDGKQILAYFEGKDGTDWICQIVLVSADDGSVRVLKTFDGGWPENMCFSPDGRYIVYDFPPKEDSPERDIFLLSTDGSREIPLVEHPSHDELLGWAPDGKNILFASDRTGTLGAWLIAVADGKPQGNPKLVKSSLGPIEALGFTQKGSFYYGISQKGNNIYIAELDLETGKILAPPKRAITRFEGYNQWPDYSPDGKYLAYISRRFPLTILPDYTMAQIGGNVLCIKSLETGEEREILPDLDKFGFPRWSPDRRSVIVGDLSANNQEGYYKQIDTQTGKVTPIVFSDMYEEVINGPCEWSRDGKAIFYVRHNRKAKIFRIIVRDLESGTENEIYRSDDYLRISLLRISLSPDGQWLALRIHSDEKVILKAIPSVGGEHRELYRFEAEEGIKFRARASITWTADGKYILFTMKDPKKDDPEWELCRIPAAEGEPEKLGLEMTRFKWYSLTVHPDGRHIAFSSTEQSSAEVWVMENFLPGFTAGK